MIELSGAAQKLTEDVNAVFNRYNISSPLIKSNINSKLEPVKTGEAVERPNLPSETPKVASGNLSLEVKTETNKDSVFDEIPSGVKVAFISYSWDDKAHCQWVLKLSNALIKKGIHTLLDQYLPKGYPLTHFMEHGIDIADRVIVVGSPRYLEKSRKETKGGVPYEDSIISSTLMSNIASTKFLPVIHGGTFDKCLPSKLSNRLGFDFSDDMVFDEKVNELARAIYDVPACPRPTLGPIPNFTYDNLTTREKDTLKDSGTDFRKAQDMKWLDRLVGSFSFGLMHEYLTNDPTWVDEKVFISSDLWDSIIAQPTFRIYDSELSRIILTFHDLWHKVCMIGLSYYCSEPGTHKVKFYGLQHDEFTSSEADKAFHDIVKIQLDMQPLLKEMAMYIQDHYEIDVEETSLEFINSLEK